MRQLVFILPVLSILNAISLCGQTENASTKSITGKIIDDSLGYALPYVHLWNESTRNGGISDRLGEFVVEAKTGDTVVFSAIGYLPKLLIVTNALINQNIEIRLMPQRYEIGEAVVRSFGDYETFKERFLELDLRDTPEYRLREYFTNIGTVAALEADGERIARNKLDEGFGFGFCLSMSGSVNNDKIAKEQVERIKRRQRVIDEKFNRAIVKDVTQLEGDELTDFIASCNFSEDFLYDSDLYTILEAIERKFIVYKHKVALDSVS